MGLGAAFRVKYAKVSSLAQSSREQDSCLVFSAHLRNISDAVLNLSTAA